MEQAKKQHLIGLVMLSAVALFWGAGFVLNSQLLKATFENTPSLLNAIRFAISALCLLAVFNKKIKFTKNALIYGGVGGALLFIGFFAQLVGMKYTTPSHSGFFTASYVIFVPFISWILYRKCPHWITFVGMAIATAGLFILNLPFGTSANNSLTGDALTLSSALMFALQIVWADFALSHNKTDHVQLTFWQIAFAGALFVLYSVIFESKYYSQISWDTGYDLWRLVIVVFGGTAFAYYAQTFAQVHLNPSETSLIMACESPIGAILSVILAIEALAWQTVVGGILVFSAVILCEIVPQLHSKRKRTPPPEEPPDENQTP